MFKTTIIAVSFAAVMAMPASAGTRFGAKFGDRETTGPIECVIDEAAMCSAVMAQAHLNIGKEKAPRDGVLQKIRIRSCTPGTFVLQFAKISSGKAKVLRSGPLINYQGDPANCDASSGNETHETFSVNVKVKQGERLAVAGTDIGFHYNSGSGPSLIFVPPLRDGGGFRTDTNTLGHLLIQAEYQ